MPKRMNTKAGVVSTEYLISRILSKINAQNMAPTSPMSVARMNEEKMEPKIMPNSTCLDRMACSKANANTMLNTLPMAASKIRMVELFCDMLSCLTVGATTAEAVPPNTHPIIKPTMGSILSISQTTNHTAIAEKTKFKAVSLREGMKESFKLLKLNCVPLSKRINTKVTAERMLPNRVSLSESTQWVMGPMKSPMMMRNNTSGILRLLNMELNRCAAKMSKPMMAIIRPILLDDNPVEMVWLRASI